MLFVLLAAGVGGFFHYRALERRTRLAPEVTRLLGTARTIAGQFEYLRRQGIATSEQHWNAACVKNQWYVARPGSAGDDYRRDMQTFANIIDGIQAKYSWDELGEPAVESFRRLMKLRDWFVEQADNQEGWLCKDEGMLDTLASLADVSAAWQSCLKELATLQAEDVLSNGTPAFAKCAANLPDSVDAAETAGGPALAERVVPLGAAERGDETVRAFVARGQWKTYVRSPDGRRVAYVVKRDKRHFVVVDGEAGLPYEYIWMGMEGGGAGGPMFSDDSQHVAYSAKREDGWHVVVDGEEGPAWSSIQSLTLSEDGRVAYAGASRDGRWHTIVDGQEQPHPATHQSHIVFSPDGRRVAYHSEDENDFFLVANGIRGRAYPAMFSAGPYFSPDSRRLAYVAGRAPDQQVVMVDAEEMPALGAVVPPVMFSPDSRRVAYVANAPRADSGQRSGGQMLVLDGTPGPAFDRVTGFAFSDDSQHYLYVGQRAQRGVVVVDGRESPAYDGLSAPGPHFSPDSEHVGWAALLNGKMQLVVDGEPGQAWVGGIAGGSPVWSADSSRIGYVAGRGRQAFAVVDDREGVAYDAITGNVVFSPDAARFAYIARRADRWYVVLDKKEGPAFDEILSTEPLFSDDSKRLAYVAKRGGEEFVVVDGREQPGFRDVDPASLRFGPDSAHLAYAAWKAGWRLVVDGRATTNRVAGRSEELPVEFDSPTLVSMWGMRGVPAGLVRVDVTLASRTAMRGATASED